MADLYLGVVLEGWGALKGGTLFLDNIIVAKVWILSCQSVCRAAMR